MGSSPEEPGGSAPDIGSAGVEPDSELFRLHSQKEQPCHRCRCDMGTLPALLRPAEQFLDAAQLIRIVEQVSNKRFLNLFWQDTVHMEGRHPRLCYAEYSWICELEAMG